MTTTTSIEKTLASWKVYEAYISRLHEKHCFSTVKHTKKQEGVALSQFFREKEKFAKLLAREVANSSYTFSPFVEREFIAKGKLRICYDQTITDRIVSGVIVDTLRPYVAQLLSPRVYSHQKGRSYVDAIFDLAEFARRHRRTTKCVQQRGLYVLQTDIKQYESSIDMSESSQLWQILERVFEQDKSYDRHQSKLATFIRSALRPEVITLAKEHCTHIVGAPLGTPQNSLVNTLYGMMWDEYLEGFQDAFYARYSDDILFASADLDTVQLALEGLQHRLKNSKLSLHAGKTQISYWTGCGKASSLYPEMPHTQQISYLGLIVSFHGETMLTQARCRSLLSEVKQLTNSSLRALHQFPLDDQAATICGALKQLFAGESLCASSATQAQRLVTSRSQLKQLDYLIALVVAKALTGKGGASAFRLLPIRRLREEFGLLSLLQQRNQHGTEAIRPSI